MSVPESWQKDGKMKVLVKAQQLTIYTVKICCNQKIFLPEYQNALTNDIIRTSKNIFIYCWTANGIRVGADTEKKKERQKLQEKAILECNNLLAMMQIAQKLFHLKLKRVKYWGEKTVEVKGMIRSWKEADQKRFKKAEKAKKTEETEK